MRILILSCLMTMPLLSFCQQTPIAFPEDSHILHVPFQENNVVRLKAKTFITSQILFAKEEAILAVEGGDTSAWMVTYHDHLPNMMFIKPTILDSKTNMTVVTSKHTYYFQISSNEELKSKNDSEAYAVKFDYPPEEPIKKTKPSPNPLKKAQVLNRNYRFSGSVQVLPARVYDDGHFTYFELTDHQAVPAIFAVDDKDGKESVVNLRQKGNTLIVQRLAPQFTLRHGNLVASIFNTEEINRIQQGRR